MSRLRQSLSLSFLTASYPVSRTLDISSIIKAGSSRQTCLQSYSLIFVQHFLHTGRFFFLVGRIKKNKLKMRIVALHWIEWLSFCCATGQCGYLPACSSVQRSRGSSIGRIRSFFARSGWSRSIFRIVSVATLWNWRAVIVFWMCSKSRIYKGKAVQMNARTASYAES